MNSVRVSAKTLFAYLFIYLIVSEHKITKLSRFGSEDSDARPTLKSSLPPDSHVRSPPDSKRLLSYTCVIGSSNLSTFIFSMPLDNVSNLRVMTIENNDILINAQL